MAKATSFTLSKFLRRAADIFLRSALLTTTMCCNFGITQGGYHHINGIKIQIFDCQILEKPEMEAEGFEVDCRPVVLELFHFDAKV
mmetsp:Transcript_14375/g.15861  ORF Transcript_14375/g.15861 Transcript_14375/m.15861 type:complete len:86 (+) Transcript_14375:1458-1715(+)